MNTLTSPCLRFRVSNLLAAGVASLALLVSAAPVFAQAPAPAANATTPITSGPDVVAVANAYRSWLAAVASAHGDPAPMLKFYDPNAILVATYSPVLLHNNKGELADYFVKFTGLPDIHGVTNDLETRVYGDWAINTGLYTFTFNSPDEGYPVSVPARFTYVYHKDPATGQWLIVDHHSSLVPPSL